MNGIHEIRSYNKQSTRTFSFNFIYINFNLKSWLRTRKHVRTSGRNPGPLPGHTSYFHFRTSQYLQQGNFWVTRKRQVLPDHIQIERLLLRIGGCFIHICIQGRNNDYYIQRCISYIHWSQEYHPVLIIYHTIHGGHTLLNTVFQQPRSRFGAPPHRRLWSSIWWPREAGNNFSTTP